MSAEAAVTAPPPTGIRTNIAAGGSGGPREYSANTFTDRFSSAIDHLYNYVRQKKTNSGEFLRTCIYLSRLIDYAIVNHEVPSRSKDLHLLVKLVCQNKNDTLLLAATMVLMVSVKSACQNGWFSDGDSKELSYLAKEIANNFCNVADFDSEPSCSFSVISTIMSRFYPRMKLGHIIVAFEVKPGYDAYVRDFQISKNLMSSPGSKIRLFVVQTDSVETSSCLITPSKVNFVLNGTGVEARCLPYVDTGPQIPTLITPMLRYGPNLLQALGDFNGNYVIAVAFICELESCSSDTLQDYEQVAPATLDADLEVTVGSSRISLNCPISSRRIKIPVKGQSCRHIQCFDFDNYVDINSRRPSWRCAYCNRHVCFSDLRIDQNMVKVLEEVGANVSDVIFSPDGSWNAVTGTEDAIKISDDDTVRNKCQQPADVLDLTMMDDAMDAALTCETEDIKLSSLAHVPQTWNTNDVDQSSDRFDREFWSGLLMSSYGLGPSNAQSCEPTAGASRTTVLNESFTSPHREVETLRQSVVTNEYGRPPSIPGYIVRSPNSRQQDSPFTSAQPPRPTAALLEQNQVRNTYGMPTLQTTNLRSYLAASSSPGMIQSSMQSSGSFTRPQTFHGAGASSSSGMIQSSMQSSGSFTRPQTFQGAGANSSSGMIQSSMQSSGSFTRPQTFHGAGASSSPGMIQSSTQSSGSFPRPQTFHGAGASSSPGMIQSSMQSSGSFLCPQTFHGAGFASDQQYQIAAANRAAQMSINAPSYSWNPDGHSMQTPRGGDQRVMSGAASQPVNTDHGDPSWRPAARMRGALTGPAYDNAYNEFICRPNLQVEAVRPPMSNATNVGTQLQASMATGGVRGAISAPNSAPVPVNRNPMDPFVRPNASFGMQ